MARPEAKKVRKNGRPTKLNEVLVAAILTDLEQGASQRIAAEANGIHERTFQFWMQWGREAKSSDNIYFQFLQRVLEAEGKAARRATRVFYAGALRDPATAERWLRLRQSVDWGGAIPPLPDAPVAHDDQPELVAADYVIYNDAAISFVQDALERYRARPQLSGGIGRGQDPRALDSRPAPQKDKRGAV